MSPSRIEGLFPTARVALRPKGFRDGLQVPPPIVHSCKIHKFVMDTGDVASAAEEQAAQGGVDDEAPAPEQTAQEAVAQVPPTGDEAPPPPAASPNPRSSGPLGS